MKLCTQRVAILACRLIVSLLTMCLLVGALAYAQPDLTRKVLILNSYHKGFKWTDEQVSAVEEVLSDGIKNLDLFVDYMDTKRIYSEKYLEHLLDIYRLKYKNFHLDAIITTDDNALRFVLKYHKEIFGEAPVIFCGINDYKRSLLKGKQKFTGLVEVLDIKPTIDLALKLRPKTRKIVVILDSTPTGLGQKRDIAAVASHYNDLEFEYIEGKDTSHAELSEKLRSLSKDSIVLLTVWLRDKNNVYLSPNDGGRLISSNSAVPVYGIIDMYYGYGIVGGKVLNSRTHGRIAAEIALRIIKGEKPANIPVIFKSANPYMFDYKQLERWKINLTDLPKGSIIINKPISLYKEYKGIIWSVIGIFAFLIFIVLILSTNILRRKKAEGALRKSEERFALATDGTNDGLWDWDLETNEAYHSDQFARMLGYEPGELPYTSAAWSDQLHPDDREKAFARLQDCLEGKTEVYESTFRMRTKSCEYRWITGRGLCVRKNGKPTRIVGFNTDITGRKETEIELRKSEEKWKNILINTPQIGVALNPKAQIIFANAHFLNLTGWKESEVIGQDWFGMFIPDNMRDELRSVFLTVMKQRDTTGFSTYENKILNRNGRLFDVAWSNVVTKDAQGNIVDVTCLGIDLTERKKAEKGLRASEDKFSKAFHGSPLLMSISEIESGRYLEVNEEFSRKTGYERNDAIGKTSIELDFISNEDRLRIARELDNNGRISDLELELIKADGSSLICLYSGEVIEVEGQDRLLSIALDLTERKKMEERFQDSQKMESIGNLAGGIAHDFNNILFPIVGMAELLLEDLPQESLEYENARQILKAGLRASDLVKQILAFSRKTEHKKIPVHVQSVLKEVLKLSRSTIPSYIDINQDIQSDCGLIMADPTQIHQVAMNLITNAYHAVETNGGDLFVRLQEKMLKSSDLPDPNLEPGKYVILSVSDSGKGMSPELMAKIFEPYFTTKEQGKGTGLGLAVVHGIIQDHRGVVKVTSEIGKGTTFEVYLPLMGKSDAADPIEEAKNQPSGNERVLLVDDEESIAKLEKQMLERLGYQVTVKNSSWDALQTFISNTQSFDLLVTDMTMPNMTGAQLAEEVKSIRSDIPLILCTGFSERINAEKAKSIGINGFLMKPVAKSELAQLVRKVLDEAASDN